MADAPTPSGGRPAADLRSLADALRNRVDLFGKTLAGVATLGTTAVGLSRIGDLFPAGDDEGWVVLACAGLLAAALAAIGIAVRLMRVARPLVMRPDPDQTDDLDAADRAAVQPVYEAAARRFGYTSLIGLQERERSLRSAAARAADADERARRTALADEVKNEIEQALARAQVAAVRRRSTDAVTGPLAWAHYLAFLLGLLAFAVGTDKVASERLDPAGAKACAQARKAGATAKDLKAASCEGKEAAAPPAAPPTAAEARATLATQLAAALEACATLAAAEGAALRDADCEPISDALARTAKPGG